MIRTLISLFGLITSFYHQGIFAALPPIIDGYNPSGNEIVAPMQLQQSLSPKSKMTLSQLEARVVYLENAIDSLSPLVDQVQTLSQQLQEIQGTLEKKSLSTTQPQSIQQTVSSKASAPLVTTRKSTPGKRVPETGVPAAWKTAMEALRKKRYTVAAQHFEKFLKQYPTDPNRSSAQYFLGQLSLLQSQPDQALRYFKTFIRQKPQDPRIPDAQFQIGLAYYAKGDNKTAITIFRQLQQQYPASQAAKTARQQLQRLKVD